MRSSLASASILLLTATATALGPQHVVVLARADSLDSLRIANAYLEGRKIPADHLILLPYKGSPHSCKWDEFERDVLKPTRKAIQERKLEKSIHVWATTLGLPWKIDGNSLSSAIHFGKIIQPQKSPLLGPAGFTEINRYAGVWLSIDAFNSLPGAEHRPIHMHLAAGSVDSTVAMIKRSAGADGSFPSGTVYLCDGAGPRATRKIGIPQATRFLKALGAKVEHLSESQFTGKTDVVGLFTGDIRFPTKQNTFLPGAIADHLTSTGGVLDGTGGQMMCTDFLDAGCSASYGTVVEPYNYPTKFPAAMVHAAYRAGFTAVESYWMTVAWPEQGIFVGDPLARPFGKPPAVQLRINEKSGSPGYVENEMEFALEATSANPNVGIGGIEIRIDGETVAVLGQQRLPVDATVEIQIGDKSYKAASTTPTVLNTLLDDLRKQLTADGMEVSRTAASLMIQRAAATPPPPVKLKCGSPVLHGDLAGGGFLSGQGEGGKDFAWIRFSTGPTKATLQTKLDVGKVVDGRHRFNTTAVSGDETMAAGSTQLFFVKKTKSSRIHLKAQTESVSLSKTTDRIDVAEASLEGAELSPPIEFFVDDRLVEARLKPPYVLAINPKSFGLGTHVVRARTTNPLQYSDESILLCIFP